MESFRFNGKSSLDIIEDELFICEFETSESLPTTTREVIKGETNKYRNVSNYFGIKDSDPLILPVGLVKKTGNPFSIDERDVIEGWLTDNDIPKPFVITDSNGKTSTFNGIVTSYDWRVVGSYVIGISFYLECDSKYYYKDISVKDTITSFGNYLVYNESKELETYPTITVENKRNNPTVFKIKNDKDDLFFEISLKANEIVTIDSRLCMIRTGQSYEELGLDKKEYINWPKLYKGTNIILCKGGDFDITTEFKVRKLGLGSYFGDYFNNEDKKGKTRISGNDLILNGVGHIENSSLIVTGTISSKDIIF